jgi:uncharacterized membrane protein
MAWTVPQALDHWEKRKLLTKAKANELRQSLPPEAASSLKPIEIFSVLGAVLIGLGIILFVASHWEEINSAAKTGLLLLTMMATGIGGYWLAFEKKNYEKTGMAILFLNVLVFGATIFLMAQIYHLPLSYWKGMLMWGLGTLYLGYVLKSRLHVWLSIPLLLMALAWYYGNQRGEEFFALLEGGSNILPFLGFLGLMLISAAILHWRTDATRFASKTLFHWGVFLVLFLMVISTVDRSTLFDFLRYPITSPVGIAVFAVALLVMGATVLFGSFQTKQGQLGLVGLGAYLCVVVALSEIPERLGLVGTGYYGYFSDNPAILSLYVIHVILVFVLCLLMVWFGSLLRQAAVINMGLIAIAAFVFIQYFSWVTELLDRSIAFIIGGVLILGLGFILERQRRRILASIVPNA